MKKFFDKAKSTFQELQDSLDPSESTLRQQGQNAQPHPSQITAPTPDDILRYRYHHGVNLGSVFVLEKWLFSSPFPEHAKGDSELDAVSASVKEIGIEPTKQKWEQHWRDAVPREEEWNWFVNEARGNCVRLPIGYFTLGAQFCENTPFEKYTRVYANAWETVRAFVSEARRWGVGVLLDLHALPGGANGEAHSGSSDGKAGLWGNRRNLERGRRALGWIATEVARGMEGVVGIQACNEAVHDAEGMYEWYESVIHEIGAVDQRIPVYISDAWNLERCLQWCNGRKIWDGARNPVVIDTHRYYTFSDEDRSQPPQQIIGRIGSELKEVDGKEGALGDKGEAQVVVGEWSCVLDGQTWWRVRPEEKDELVKQFGQAESWRWQQKAGGSFFWTWKMSWMDGGEWGFVEQTKKGNVMAPQYLMFPAQEIRNRSQAASAKRQEMAAQARQGHEGYWNHTAPGQQFPHHLYSEGWEIGFSDAQAFFNMRASGALGEKAMSEGGDKIGCLEIWVKKRLLESGQRGEFVWIWEQGFRAGVAAFYHCVGI